MYDFAVIVDWLTFAVRWFHVIAGIAWIGSSFYFIALDLGLRKYAYTPEKVGGEQMQIHGGGFYRMQKLHGRPGQSSRASRLVQMGSLFDLAFWIRTFGPDLLSRSRPLPSRHVEAEHIDHSRNIDFDSIYRTRVDIVRPRLQKSPRKERPGCSSLRFLQS